MTPVALAGSFIRYELTVKNLPANEGAIRDAGSIPGSGRFPEGGHGNLLQYSCLENPMTEEPGGLPSMGLAKSQTQLKRLSTHTHDLVQIPTESFPEVV